MLSTEALATLVQDKLLPDWRKERERLDRIDRWYRWDPDDIQLPKGATPELKALRELSRVPWLGLVVTSTAQCMYVDGYRSRLDPVGAPLDPAGSESAPDGPPHPMADPSGPWRIWLSNGWDERQIAVHRAMLAYGYAYATALPGKDFQGKPMPQIRGVSPRKMFAWYEDTAEDDWAIYAMRVKEKTEVVHVVDVFDDEFVYTVKVDSAAGLGKNPVELLGQPLAHESGVCPVVRYCNQLDLDGRTPGEVEPHIPLAARINKTAYDRMLTQHFNSWKVRTVAGMAEPDTEEAARRKKLQLRQDDLLVADDPDTKFGSLPETPLQGFIQAHETDVQSLAAVSQTPTHELTGQMANLSAEALAAARASLTQKVAERQKSAGRSHIQLLRLASGLHHDDAHATDITSRVTWQDMNIRSMAQAVDALGKAAQMLQVPVEALWGRIPGVEKSDVEEWIQMRLNADPITQMQMELARQGGGNQPGSAPPGVPGNDPAVDRTPVGPR